jgi:hypothetical protein
MSFHPRDHARTVASELAGELEQLRRVRGHLTRAQFSAMTGIPHDQITMIEDGVRLPSHKELVSYMSLAGLSEHDREDLYLRWESAKTLAPDLIIEAGHGPVVTPDASQVLRFIAKHVTTSTAFGLRDRIAKPAWRRSIVASQAKPELWPDPDQITTIVEFTTALEAIKSSTALSYDALAKASSRLDYPLARSTVHAMCTKAKLPTNPLAVGCFIRICGGDSDLATRWITAWQRLIQNKDEPKDKPAKALVAKNLDQPDDPPPASSTVAPTGLLARRGLLDRTTLIVMALVFLAGLGTGALLL